MIETADRQWRPWKRTRNVRLVADVGLFILPGLTIEILTGLILFAIGRGLVPSNAAWAQSAFHFLAAHNLVQVQDIGFQTNLHVWVGYLTTWAIGLKAIASWPTLRGWWPRKFAPFHLVIEKSAAWGLLVLAPASYLTGAAISLHLIPFHSRLVRDVHLWVSVLLLVVFAWHVWQFFPTGMKVLWVQLRRIR